MVLNKGKPKMHMVFWFFVFTGLLMFPFVLSADEEKAGTETCLECHDDMQDSFSMNVHMRLTSNSEGVCESCHGPGAAHAEEGEPDLIYNPKTEFDASKANNCLECHKGGQFESDAHMSHSEAANGCNDCHTVHSNKKQLLNKDSRKLCLDCHRDVEAQMSLPSHHPVKEGRMQCISCHNVHGGTAAFASAGGENELCYSCHTSKEGPFVYEHQPVAEDCKTCHTPHGSVADNLLVQNEPALCMSCHPVHFHTGITAMDGDFTAPVYPTRGGTSTVDGFKRGMMTKCTQCHTAVHGSDMPSQGTTSQGKSLTR